MVALSYAVSNQIRLLVSNLNKKSYKTSVGELKDIARLYGDDARLCLLLCLVEEIDFHDPKNQKDHFKIALLLQELGELSLQPNFASMVCRALHANVLSNDFFGSFAKVAKLPFSQALLIALGLVQSADKKQKEEGLKFLKAKTQDMTEFSSEQLTDHVLSQLIYFVRETDELPSKQKTSFLTALELLYPKIFSSSTLLPIVREHEPDVSDANSFPTSEIVMPLITDLHSHCKVSAMLRDLGCAVCESSERFQEFLSSFKLTTNDVAEMIAVILRTKDEQSSTDEDFSLMIPMAGNSPIDIAELALDPNEAKTTESKRSPAQWNVAVFVETITELYPDLSWSEVFASFDIPHFLLPDTRSFNLFLQIFQLTSIGTALPVECLFHVWDNRTGQLSLIRHILQSPLSILHFPNAQKLLHSQADQTIWLSLDLLEILLVMSDSDISYDIRDLVDIMQARAPELLLSGLLQLSGSCDKGVSLLNEITSELMRTHLDDSEMMQRLWLLHFEPIVQWFVRLYLEQSAEGNSSGFLSQILRFTQATPGALAKVLEADHSYFAIDLATVASTMNFLDLEAWLQAQVTERGNSFVIVCCDFLRDRRVPSPGESDQRSTVSVQIAAIFFKIFMTNKETLSQACVDEVTRLYKLAGNIDPQLYSLIISVDDIEDESRSYFEKIYSQRISLPRVVDLLRAWRDSESKRDREVHACMIYNLFDEYRFFQNYPNKQLTIAGSLWGLLIQHKLVSSYTLVIALRCVLEGLRKPEESKLFKFAMWALAQFKDRLPQWPYVCSQILQIVHLRSSQPDLVSFLEQILHPQADQNKEASIQGVNSLVDDNGSDSTEFMESREGSQLADPMSLPDSNFPVDDNLEKQGPADDEERLVPPPKPAATRPESQTQEGQKALGGPEIAERIASDTVKDRPPGPPTSFGSALNIDTLLSVERSGPAPTAPSEAIKDKIHFIINNVSKSNLKVKGDKLKEVLGDELFPYFSRYLVVKRISIEANFQKLYAQFLDVVNIPKLDKQLVETTYEYIKVLLNSEKILTSSSERSLLKNLGSWLGLLTIGKNKPLRANRLNLKELVLQAYESGRLIAVVPFGAKVLEACSNSKVFKPPNPWLMALVSLLKEIFDLPDLKLNLKFEIEVLFNNLSIKIKDVKPSELLKNRIVKRNLHQNFPMLPLETGAVAEEPARLAAGRTGAYPAVPTTTEEPAQGFSPEPPSILPAYVTIHPSITLFSMYPHLKRCVPTAIDRAIREIITPVVERSVTIACVTTRELIMKDFAMEPDENKMRKAAHQMVQKLTSSLAEVTCKEPLRVSINNHLSSLLEANSSSNERTLVDQACTQVSSDNLELGINLIEKAASDRAVREIEESLAPLFAIRAKHRETTGQPYYDVSIFTGTGRFPSALPDALRPKPGGLSSAQLRVYDDFSSPPPIPQQTQPGKPGDQKPSTEIGSEFPRHSPPSSRVPSESLPPPPTLQPRVPSNPPGLPAPTTPATAPLTSQQTLDKLIGCLASLEQAVSRFANHKNTLLPSLRADHEIIVLLRMIPSILGQCPKDEATFPRDVVAFTFAHKVFKRLYERDNRHSLLQVDVHIQILRCIRQLCPKIVKELTSWLLFSDDERKYLIQITTGLLRARMLHIPEVDLYLAKLVVTVHASGQALQTRNLNPTLHPHLEFVINLVRRTVVKEPILAMQELSHLFDALTKMQTVSQRRNKPVAEVLAHLMENVRLAATANVPVAEDPASTPVPQAFPAVSNVATTPPVPVATARDPLQDQRADMKDMDEATSQLYFEEAAMDRQPWDDDPPNFRQQIVYLLEDWMNICLQGTASDKTYAQYLAVLQQQRVLASADSTSRFFLILTQLCVDRAFAPTLNDDVETSGATKTPAPVGIALNASQQQYANSMTQQAQQPAQLSYTAIDALAKLVVFLVKFFAGEGTSPNNPNAPKIRMLNAFLRSACRVLRRDFDMTSRAVRNGKSTSTFNQRPYFRLFANLLHHLNTPDPSLDSNNVEVVAAFGQCFRLLRPSRVPSFCFAWLELISHRMFMSKLLISKSTQCAVLFERLLVDLLEFMQPYLRNAELTESVRLLYKGALRVLLVLLHDFPEFLCDFHFSFCDVIPITCVQMRNLILSAFPRSMRLPDPFTPNLKVDLLPDITQPPRLLSDITSQLNRHRQVLMQPLESYLAKRSPPAFLMQIRGTLQLNAAQAKKTGTKFNVPLINSLVLYVGCQGITKLQAKSGAQFQDNACMDIFEALVTTLDAEGRYYVLNAIANQLRYPNNHTHYFSCVLLYLFLQSKQAVIMEQITRVLLERLIVHRPHPWGLLITFIELIKNPRYAFWKRAFTRCAPEIERLFDSVARSCMPAPKPAAAPPSAPPTHPSVQHPGLTHGQHQPAGHPQHAYNGIPRPPAI